MTVQIDARMFNLGFSDMTDFWFSINLTNYIEMDTNYKCRIWPAKAVNYFYITNLQYIKDFHSIIHRPLCAFVIIFYNSILA